MTNWTGHPTKITTHAENTFHWTYANTTTTTTIEINDLLHLDPTKPITITQENE